MKKDLAAAGGGSSYLRLQRGCGSVDSCNSGLGVCRGKLRRGVGLPLRDRETQYEVVSVDLCFSNGRIRVNSIS